MPRFVDHDLRRTEAIEALLDLIVDEGISAVTSRSLAHRLGLSNGALWRYFQDKDELLASAYRTVVDRTNQRVETSLSSLDGIDAVHALMQELLPVNETTRNEARIVVNFWGSSATRAPGTNTAGRPELRDWEQRICALLARSIEAGELRENTPVEVLATMFVAYAVDAQVEFVFNTAIEADAISQPVTALLDSFRS